MFLRTAYFLLWSSLQEISRVLYQNSYVTVNFVPSLVIKFYGLGEGSQNLF